MKFVKGLLIGTIVSAGVAFMYTESSMKKKKIMKAGRRFAKKMKLA